MKLDWIDDRTLGQRASGNGAEYQIVKDTKGDHEGWRVYAWHPDWSEPVNEKFVHSTVEVAQAVAQGWEDDSAGPD